MTTTMKLLGSISMRRPARLRPDRAVCVRAIAAGHKHYSMMAIIQRVRWHTTVETEGGDTFKINNNFSPYYSRQFIYNNPRFADFPHAHRERGDAVWH